MGLERYYYKEAMVMLPFINYLENSARGFADGVFGRFDLAALRGCHTLNVCLFANRAFYILALVCYLLESLCTTHMLSGTSHLRSVSNGLKPAGLRIGFRSG
jgi:hypothetical protein